MTQDSEMFQGDVRAGNDKKQKINSKSEKWCKRKEGKDGKETGEKQINSKKKKHKRKKMYTVKMEIM